MNLFQLECFLAVANHLNFARAAEQMNISQPAISHQVQSLEDELKVKLFHRSTRSVELTIEGRTFVGDAKNIVLTSRKAINRFANADHQEMLILSIGCYTYTGLHRYTNAFRRLSEKYENVHPQIMTLPDSQLLEQVENGVLDVALKIKNDSKKKSSLIYKELGKATAVCMMSMDHPLAESELLTIDQLKDHKLILYDPIHADAAITQMQWRLAEGRKPSDLYFCESLEAALLLTSSGFGISILPETFYLFQEMNLKRVPLIGIEPLSYGLFYKSYSGKPHLKDFILYMLETSNASSG